MANERSLVEEQNRYDRILELAPAKEAVSIEIAFVFVITWSLDINYWWPENVKDTITSTVEFDISRLQCKTTRVEKTNDNENGA